MPETKDVRSKLQRVMEATFSFPFRFAGNVIKGAYESADALGQKAINASQGKPVQVTSEDTAHLFNTLVGPGLLAGPSGPATLGVIRQPDGVAKHIRKLMQAEIQARGKGAEGDIFGQILRQNMYRGQKTIPVPDYHKAKAGKVQFIQENPAGGYFELGDVPTMERARSATRNIGETGWRSGPGAPGRGVSMTVDPRIANTFSKRGEKISRVMPLFGGPPEEVILNSVNPAHQEILRDAYAAAVRSMGESGELKRSYNMHGEAPFRYSDLKDNLIMGGKQDEFNKLLTENLMDRGYKGVLHSPHRYGTERELQMFRGEDVLHIDEFDYQSPDVQRLWAHKAEPGKFNELLSAGHTEKRTANPAMQGLHRERQRLWDEVTEGALPGHKPGALGMIYKDVDLDPLVPRKADKEAFNIPSGKLPYSPDKTPAIPTVANSSAEALSYLKENPKSGVTQGLVKSLSAGDISLAETNLSVKQNQMIKKMNMLNQMEPNDIVKSIHSWQKEAPDIHEQLKELGLKYIMNEPMSYNEIKTLANGVGANPYSTAAKNTTLKEQFLESGATSGLISKM